MRSPLFKTGDVVRYTEDMALAFGANPKIILESIIQETDNRNGAVFMYELLEGDKQFQMWEHWIELVQDN